MLNSYKLLTKQLQLLSVRFLTQASISNQLFRKNLKLTPLDISGKHLLRCKPNPPTPLPYKGSGVLKPLSLWGRGTLRENAPRSWRGVFSIPAMSNMQKLYFPINSPEQFLLLPPSHQTFLDDFLSTLGHGDGYLLFYFHLL